MQLPTTSLLAALLLSLSSTAAAQCSRDAPANTTADLGDPRFWPTVTYDGPRYHMKASDWAEREKNDSWVIPADMPHITLQPGTHLDMGYPDDGNSTTPSRQHSRDISLSGSGSGSGSDSGSLEKRRGNRLVGAYGGYNCDSNTLIVDVTNFGCGTGCVTMPQDALSGVVLQQYHGNPYPTMDVWTGPGCQGTRRAHFGVVNTMSCTNVNGCPGYRSFVGYWDC